MAIDPLTAVFEIGKEALERIWPDPNERAAELRKLEELRLNGNLRVLELKTQLLVEQAKTNTAQASHKSLFVAGARPFVMWVCGFAFAYVAILEPLARFISTVIYSYAGEFPVVDTDITLQVLLGMLGLGGLRTYDKVKGVQTDALGKQK